MTDNDIENKSTEPKPGVKIESATDAKKSSGFSPVRTDHKDAVRRRNRIDDEEDLFDNMPV